VIRLGLVGVVLLSLVACVPGSRGSFVSVDPVGVHWYPHDVGLFWLFVPEGDEGGELPYRYFVRGANAFRGSEVVSFRISGRGNEISYHRVVGDDGVFLVAEERVGVVLTYDPPVQELPPLHQMTSGLRWSTFSDVTLSGGGGSNVFPMEFVYEMHDSELVSTPVGVVRAFRITERIFVNPGDRSELVTRTVFFAPHVGYVVNHLGLVLVGGNVVGGGR
jgi:hypothetical protein